MPFLLKASLLFFRVHLFRYGRIINQLGIFRVLILAGLLILALKATSVPDKLLWQAAIILLTILQLHLSRKDQILLSNLGLNSPLFFMLSYSLAVAPFALFYLVSGSYKTFFMLISGILLVSMLKLRSKEGFRLPVFSFPVIPADAWEWRAGLRRFAPGLFLTYLLVAVFHEQDFAVPAAVLILSLIAAYFQTYQEPRAMIEAMGLSPRAFLRRKWLLQLLLFMLIILPPVVFGLIAFPDTLRPVILVIINSLLVQIFSVSFKYAGFQPGNDISYAYALPFLLNFAFIIPVLLPLPLVMALIFSIRAHHQLKLSGI